jgi:AcrR family transcriptional regulator
MSARAAAKHQSTRRVEHREQGNGALERERVVDIQRARIVMAMTEVAVEHGVANVTVAHVVERAGVSRRTFYELFDDIEDCALGAIDDAVKRVSRRVLDAYEPDAGWSQRIRDGLVALLLLFEEDPSLGRLLLVESLSAGPEALRRRRALIERLVGGVDAGRLESQRSRQNAEKSAQQQLPSALTAEGLVSGVLGVLHGRLCEGDPDGLVGLANPLMGMIVLPYLGSAAAKRELSRPVPKPPVSHARAGVDAVQLGQLHMRLTYRTVRVLMAVAEQPGSSNRKVATIAGVSDQGQMSKLLARLQQLGLIQNTTPGNATRGEPNAWTLTTRGWQVQSAVAQQASP